MSSKRYRRASEIGEFVYCHRAWWLHHVQGHEPGNARAREQGSEAHARHGLTLWMAARVRWLAWLVAAIAVVMMVVTIFF